MSIESLIESLSKEIKPVRRTVRPVYAFLGWLAFVAAYIAIYLGFIELRADLDTKLTQGEYLWELGACLATIIGAAFAASRHAYPDLAMKKYLWAYPIIPLHLFLIILLMQITHAVSMGEFDLSHGMECAMAMCMLTILPVTCLYLALMRGFFIDAPHASFFAALAAGMTSYLALRMAEQTDDISHLFFWHTLPLILLVIALTWMGKRFLKKNS